MTEPKHGMTPIVIEETPGKRAYCQCGLSAILPHCDGAHRREETGLKPIVVEVNEAARKAICQCRRSTDLPWCDGSHRQV